MSRLTLFFILFLSLGTGCAQTSTPIDFDHYTPIQFSGTIPENFLQLSSAKVEAQIKDQVSNSENRKDQIAKEQFLLQSNFVIDEMLLSGKVLFNDPVGAYINKIADYVLRDQPQLRSELQFYAVKSTAANAFATNQGVVFVNMGLIARLHNEAELAFVLCHEIQHYVKQHPINKYVAGKRMEQGIEGNLSFDEVLLARNTFSREQETEADLDGIRLYLKTAYDPTAPDGVFDVLRDADYPVGNSPFPKSFLETEHLVFPKPYFLDSVAPMDLNEDYDDTLTSHPNIKKRRKLVAAKVQNNGKEEGGTRYLFGEANFKEVQKICRFEMTELYLHNRQYEWAFYHAFLMLQEDPDNYYHQQALGRSLYCLAKYRNARKFFELHTDYREVTGEHQQVHYFFQKLGREEMNAVALLWNWRLHTAHPQSDAPMDMVNDLLVEIKKHYPEFLPSLSEAPRSLPVEANEGAWEKEKSDFIKYTFVAQFQQDNSFRKAIDAAPSPETDSKEPDREPFVRNRKSERKARIKGKNLGLDKVVFVKPFYQKVDQRKSVATRYMDSETALGEMNGLLRDNANRVGLKIDLLDPHEFSTGDTERFNDMVMLNDWLVERLDHENIDMVGIAPEAMRQLTQKYGTSHFAWTGIFAVTDNKSLMQRYTACFYGCTIVLLPLAIFEFFEPEHTTYQFTLLFDVESGEMRFGDLHPLDFKDSKAFRKSMIYNTLLQISSK